MRALAWLATSLCFAGPAPASTAAPSSDFSVRVSIDTTANQIGRLTSVGNGQSRRFFEYDALGRERRTEHVLDGVPYLFALTFGYPVNPGSTPGLGTVTRTLTYPDGEVVAYGYDAAGQQQTITVTRPSLPAQTILAGVTRNGRGQVTQVSFGNGAITTRAFNEATDLRLNRQRTSLGATTVQDYQYGFDAAGNVTAVIDGLAPAFSASYGYDSLDQLTSMLGGSTASIYGYDRLGNLTAKEGIGQTYGGAGLGPHALAASGSTTFSYDFNGNLASTSGGLLLTWNAENMAVRASQNGQEVQRKAFVGEELWKKVEGGVTFYFLPGLMLENGQPRKFYASFAERSPDGSLKFYHRDHLGSTTVITDQFAAVVRRAAHMPYGELRAPVAGSFAPRHQFNGQLLDTATGLLDYGARLYNPKTGRWISPDSLVVDGLNRYAYVGNNPFSRIDPTGHFQQLCQGCMGPELVDEDEQRRAAELHRRIMADPFYFQRQQVERVKKHFEEWNRNGRPRGPRTVISAAPPPRRRPAPDPNIYSSVKVKIGPVKVGVTAYQGRYYGTIEPNIPRMSLKSLSPIEFSSGRGEPVTGVYGKLTAGGLPGFDTGVNLTLDRQGLHSDPLKVTFPPKFSFSIGINFLLYDPNAPPKPVRYDNSADGGFSFPSPQR